MMTKSLSRPDTGRPVDPQVDTAPAKRPGPVTLQDAYGPLEKLESRHAADGRQKTSLRALNGGVE